MPKRRRDPYVPRAPVINDGTKTCLGSCGSELPATSDYFDRDETKDDGLRSICKACRALERERAEQRRIDERIQQLDEGSLVLLEALSKHGSDVPHIAELYQRLMEVFEGAGGFAAHYMGQYLMAKPGSTTRTKMLEALIRLGQSVTQTGYAEVPANLMADEDLALVFEKGAKRLLRLTHDDGEIAEAS